MLPVILACKVDLLQPIVKSVPTEKVSTVAAVKNTGVSTIKFSGYNWIVKNGPGIGPGPNSWSEKNAWVDDAGLLHLKLSYDSSSAKWTCAGVTSEKNFGHGTYQWMIQGPISTLDKNVVTGLFHYLGPDGFNELDVEFARWGDVNKPNVNYSVYPASGTTGTHQRTTTEWKQSGGTSSTHRYTWTNDAVVIKSMNGFHQDDTNMFFTKTFTPPAATIPTVNMPVKMNLWLFRGLAPSDGKEVEIVIRSFKFTPAT